jgi:hypothetical protein
MRSSSLTFSTLFVMVVWGCSSDDSTELVGAARSGAHAEVSLAGSNFEIDADANLKVDDASPSIDWASVAETRKQDTQSGPNDESFGQGTKENTAVPTIVDGSIPPNKSDLKFFGIHQEGNTSSVRHHEHGLRVQPEAVHPQSDARRPRLQLQRSDSDPQRRRLADHV